MDVQTRKKDGVYRSLCKVLEMRHVSQLEIQECLNFGQGRVSMLESQFSLDVCYNSIFRGK
jgi:hypothetical protein